MTEYHQPDVTKLENARLLGDELLIRRWPAEDVTKGGIIIPDTAKEKPQRGKIVSVGAGKIDDNGKRIAMEVKAGQQVLFGKYAGTDIKVDGKEMLIMHESDILGIIE